MKECIDIFSRLLIATITFVVPIIINLLSTFFDGEKRRIQLAEVSEAELSKKTREDINNNPGNVKQTITDSNKQYEQIYRETKLELRRLNPTIQFWYIASCLSISFISLIGYYLIKANKWKLANFISPTFTLISSGLTYMIGLAFIIRILYTIMKTKRIIENN